MKSIRTSLILSLLLLSYTGIVRAQGESSQQVSGTGMSGISRMPETMRLKISIIGRGPNLKDALAALKDRIAKAQTQLTALGAEKDSTIVGDAQISDMGDNRNSQRRMQMQMMMMERMQRGGKASKKPPPAPPITVTAQLTAHWKLSSKSAEELLLAVHPIQEKIKAADLAGSKEAEKLTPEQEELLEEAEQNFGYNAGDEPKPGEPVFMFVIQISDAEHEKALREAYEKARSQAAQLAKAAGMNLGNLRSLGSYGGNGMDVDVDEFSAIDYSSPVYRAMQMARRSSVGGSKTEQREALAVIPGLVRHNVTMSASFDLAAKK